MGEGEYEWMGLDGNLQQATHWDDLPGKMNWIVKFVPMYPEPPHSQEDHNGMAQFKDKLLEALSRCQR